jgi:hypothetical protein
MLGLQRRNITCKGRLGHKLLLSIPLSKTLHEQFVHQVATLE